MKSQRKNKNFDGCGAVCSVGLFGIKKQVRLGAPEKESRRRSYLRQAAFEEQR